jgi:hypothetical protein
MGRKHEFAPRLSVSVSDNWESFSNPKLLEAQLITAPIDITPHEMFVNGVEFSYYPLESLRVSLLETAEAVDIRQKAYLTLSSNTPKRIVSVPEITIPVGKSIRLYSSGFLEALDQFEFLFPFFSVGSATISDETYAKHWFFYVITDEQAQVFSDQLNKFIIKFVREGYRISEEEGQRKAALIETSQLVNAGVLAYPVSMCLHALSTNKLFSQHVPLDGKVTKQLEAYGWVS